jgi:hypothetical protein
LAVLGQQSYLFVREERRGRGREGKRKEKRGEEREPWTVTSMTGHAS